MTALLPPDATVLPRLDLDEFLTAYAGHVSVATADMLTVDDIVLGLVFAQTEDDYRDTLVAYCDSLAAGDYMPAMGRQVDAPLDGDTVVRTTLAELFAATRARICGVYEAHAGPSIVQQYEAMRAHAQDQRAEARAYNHRLGR